MATRPKAWAHIKSRKYLSSLGYSTAFLRVRNRTQTRKDQKSTIGTCPCPKLIRSVSQVRFDDTSSMLTWLSNSRLTINAFFSYRLRPSNSGSSRTGCRWPMTGPTPGALGRYSLSVPRRPLSFSMFAFQSSSNAIDWCKAEKKNRQRSKENYTEDPTCVRQHPEERGESPSLSRETWDRATLESLSYPPAIQDGGDVVLA